MDLPARYSAYKMSIFQGKVLLVKKLEIEKTKPTFTLKTLKVVYLVGFVFSSSNFFINKKNFLQKKKNPIYVVQYLKNNQAKTTK